jgi:hypothetical protein
MSRDDSDSGNQSCRGTVFQSQQSDSLSRGWITLNKGNTLRPGKLDSNSVESNH